MLEYLDRIAKRLGPKLKFDVWGEDDIRQEIYILMLAAQKEYDPKKGEAYRFYFNFVSARLKNFRRDNYSSNPYRKAIADAGSLEMDVIESQNNFIRAHIDLIDERVDAKLRGDYLRWKEGVKLPHKRKNIIINHVKEIVGRIIKNEEVTLDD